MMIKAMGSQLGRRQLLALILAAAACTPTGASRGTAADPGSRTSVAAVSAGMRPFCLGRYSFNIPADAVLHGRTQSLAHMDVDVRTAAPGETLDAAAAAVEADQRADAQPPSPPTRRETIATDTVLLVSEVTSYGWTTTKTAVVRLAGGHVFVVSGEHEQPEGIAAQREAAVEIARAIVASSDAAPAGSGFCIDGGTVDRPFQYNEQASAGFDLPTGAHLTVTIISNGRVVPESLAERTPGGLQGLLGLGIRAETLRSGSRTAGGHRGDELLLARQDGPGDILFQWVYPGEPMSGTAPSIEIRLEGAHADAQGMLATWDAILGSLRRR